MEWEKTSARGRPMRLWKEYFEAGTGITVLGLMRTKKDEDK
jgi:hypothetical protein